MTSSFVHFDVLIKNEFFMNFKCLPDGKKGNYLPLVHVVLTLHIPVRLNQFEWHFDACGSLTQFYWEGSNMYDE